MKPSCQSQIHFNYQFWRPDSIQFLCFQVHILAGLRLGTRLYSILLLPASELFFITLLHGPRRKHSLSIAGKACLQFRCLSTDVLLLRALAPAGMCLPSHCLAMGLYVTIYRTTSVYLIHDSWKNSSNSLNGKSCSLKILHTVSEIRN
jgi:hypothetical protein